MMEKVIATEILKSIREHLNNPDLSDEEKLDYITFEAMTKLARLRQQAAYPIEPLCLHVAKQVQFPKLEDWSKEMARNHLNNINKYILKIRDKKRNIDFISEEFTEEIENSLQAKRVLKSAIKEVQENAIKKGLKIPEVQEITEEQFMKIWEAFYTLIIPNLGTEDDFEKEDVRKYLEQAVKQAGLSIEFQWR